MNVRELYRQVVETLTTAGVEAAAADGRELVEFALQVPVARNFSEVDGSSIARVRQLVQRRVRREPVQHITGRMFFRALTLKAAAGVFVVRPETEMVAEAAIELARDFSSPVVVDLCTGSGAIAAAVASEVPTAQVHAVEISAAAVTLAHQNLPPAVSLVEGDATNPAVLAYLDGTVNVVVSNPPYLPVAVVDQPEALADPPAALYGGGKDGLRVPIRIIARAATLLAPGGFLVMEHDPSQSEYLRRAAHGAGFVSARTQRDLTGRERYLVAGVAH
ncbi:MAG: HemK/PrmC family methyltransferase [Actinomycetaceae bacterium]|nr:HemK/PrmC family methyltransferase [Actinomycetaceae bacterium]